MVRKEMVIETLKLRMVPLLYAEGFRVLANPRGPPAIPERLMIILAIVIRCRRHRWIYVLCHTGRSPLLQLQICQFVTVRLVSENQVGA